jgi:hypothetical protein
VYQQVADFPWDHCFSADHDINKDEKLEEKENATSCVCTQLSSPSQIIISYPTNWRFLSFRFRLFSLLFRPFSLCLHFFRSFSFTFSILSFGL